ncbi:hypothetical protein GVN16_04470 [Emticicia sp. CRIBPO]|uniref:hypothetical protein n=1 Tax=Emticicia sp. CRIBPO TaxID=2683258 RepID=UPI0014126107|nr:hypothetical protein [Emticicia sp. CRIBPO]NBA84999.1 hypothetical protein [Emticicia sp. CRIBPO]
METTMLLAFTCFSYLVLSKKYLRKNIWITDALPLDRSRSNRQNTNIKPWIPNN